MPILSPLKQMRLKLSGLSIYRGVLNLPAAGALFRLLLEDYTDPCELAAACANATALLAEAGCLEHTVRALENAVLWDDNPYTRCLAAGRKPSHLLEAAALRDLDALRCLALFDPAKQGQTFWTGVFTAAQPPLWSPGRPEGVFAVEPGELPTYLADFHRANGCGVYAAHAAFLWDGGMVPILHSDPITLEELKGYELPRKKVLENTENFLQGYRASNMLLYGDRGTGKSSTVHAILNRYRNEGLRMLELPKEGLRELPRISEELGGLPLKFIIFIDDLSFSETDDSFGALKAILEGSLAARPDNLLIYATSNRRHLIRENHSDRQGDEVHAVDTMQEQLSLSDRFGITVTFLNPGRAQFYEILDGMAADRNLEITGDDLHAAAERWALSRGGRSPRIARQFIDFAQSRLLRGLPLD